MVLREVGLPPAAPGGLSESVSMQRPLMNNDLTRPSWRCRRSHEKNEERMHALRLLLTDNRLPLPQMPERCVPACQVPSNTKRRRAASTVTPRETCSASDWRAPGALASRIRSSRPFSSALLPHQPCCARPVPGTRNAGRPALYERRLFALGQLFRGPCYHAHNKLPYDQASLSFHGEKRSSRAQKQKDGVVYWCGQGGQGDTKRDGSQRRAVV